jgi:hypothetical protein
MRIDSLPSFNYAHLPLAEEEAELRPHARDDQGKADDTHDLTSHGFLLS